MTDRTAQSVDYTYLKSAPAKTRTRLNDNERAYAIQLISFINEFLADKDIRIKRAGGERTINTGGNVKFPDVLLFADKAQSMILQGWEIKCPDVPIHDEAFVNDAHNKATLLWCNSYVLWNFQYAQLHVKNEEGTFDIAESWTIDSEIVDRPSIDRKLESWVRFLRDLILKLNTFISTGRIQQRSLGDALTESVMPRIVNEGKAPVAEELKRRNATDIRISMHIESWWASVQKQYLHDESDPYLAYAKTILLNWLSKLMFAHILTATHEAARAVDGIAKECSVQEALDIFGNIVDRCGFNNAFTEIAYDDALPNATWNDLVVFNQIVSACDILSLGPEYRHRMMRDCIAEAKRQIGGQYPTPEPLADLMAAIAVRNAQGQSWDPCCGTGTIGMALWRRKENILKAATPQACRIASETTWVSDIHDFPLQIAGMGMASLAQAKAPLRLFQADALETNVGSPVNFIDPDSGETAAVPIPLFDSIASNLPFVDFNTSNIPWSGESKRLWKKRISRQTGVDLSERNDLYCFIALHLTSMLAPHGVACLLTSSSWLTTKAGESFFDALTQLCHIDGIYVNGESRWFDTDVMNALIVIENDPSSNDRGTYFGLINVSIEELEDENLRNRIARSIVLHSASDTHAFKEQLLEPDQIRRLRDRGLSLYSLCFGVGGIDAVYEKLCKVKGHFALSRQIKSGQNEAFYSSDPDFVDEPFRFGLVKNLTDTKRYIIHPNKFCMNCDKSEEELQRKGFEKTLAHIRSFEGRLNRSVLSHKPYWYTLPNDSKFVLATMMNPYRRLFFARIAQDRACYADQRVIGLYPVSKNVDIDLCLALLNTMVSMLLLEANAGPMGLGALNTRKENLVELEMLDPALLDDEQQDEIRTAFAPLMERDILDTAEELEQDDRQAFDHAVMKAFGIDEHFGEVKAALLAMQRIRLG